MSYLEKLRKQRSAPEAALHMLRISVSTKKFDLLLVFEGEEDEAFYCHHLRDILRKTKYQPIICDGKGGVYALYEIVKTNNYDEKSNVFYFVDADHDRYLDIEEYPDNFFVTCGYSIENYFFDRELIIEISRLCYNIQESDPILKYISNKFDEDSEIFINRAASIMTLLILLRLNDIDFDKNEIKYSKLFEYNKHGVLLKKKFSCDNFPVTSKLSKVTDISYSDIISLRRNLRNDDPQCIIRGKIISEFIAYFVKSLQPFLSDKKKMNGKTIKLKIDLNRKNLIHIYTRIMPSIEKLVKFGEFIRKHMSSR
jgi:hypothetical protein